MTLLVLSLAHAQEAVIPPDGFHVGIGVGLGSSTGAAVIGDVGAAQEIMRSAAAFSVGSSVRLRFGGGFTLEPELECAVTAGWTSDGDTETARGGLDDCVFGVSVRPRLAARGSLELYGT